MLSDTEIEALAKQHLKETYPVDCEILSGRRLSNPDGIYFVANRRSENPHGLQRRTLQRIDLRLESRSLAFPSRVRRVEF